MILRCNIAYVAAMSKEISLDTRKIIIKLFCEGKSMGNISKIIGRAKSSVQYVIKHHGETGLLKSKPRSGRPKILTDTTKRSIVRKIKDNPRMSAPKIADELRNNLQITVSDETVRNVLRENNYHGRTPRRKPLISETNRKKRLLFAKMHINKDAQYWKRVVFTDESKYNIFGSDGRGKVWRKPNDELNMKNVVPTVKHGGGNVMVWGCMAASGVGKLHFIESTMDRWIYLDVLKTNLRQSVTSMGIGNDFIFQQDNDPKHTSMIVKEWLLYNVPKQLHSPPQSPDLNPIEHLWEELERRIRKHSITNKQMLKTKLQEEWNLIGSETTKKLVDSMPRRLAAVIKANGNSTKY